MKYFINTYTKIEYSLLYIYQTFDTILVKGVIRLSYELLMFLLVLVTIVSLWNPHPYFSEINTFIWLIFFID